MIRHELVAFPGCGVAGFSEVPGSLSHEEGAGAQWLHYAPGRWLLVESVDAVAGESTQAVGWATPGDAMGRLALAVAEAAVVAGTAALFDVDGKFHGFAFDGESGRTVLATTVNLEAVLPAGRGCATVPLFDCPAVLQRTPGGYLAWLSTSHVADFTAAAERAGHICAKL